MPASIISGVISTEAGAVAFADSRLPDAGVFVKCIVPFVLGILQVPKMRRERI